MITVKIITPSPPVSLSRQIPLRNGLSNINFSIDDDLIKECDYCVVLEDLENTKEFVCSSKNLILFTLEPPSIKSYCDKFLNQFDRVVTCHKNLNHNNLIYSQCGYPWHIGINQRTGGILNYNDLQTNKIYKNKLISIISSNKKMTSGHRNRINFSLKVKNYFGDAIDFFGRGFNPIDDKWHAIAPYKYHIVIENEQIDHYFTEKLADCFLGEAYPIYYGANNIFSYFSHKSLVKVDINKPIESIKIIESTINSNTYEKHYKDICDSKQKILNEYNIFSVIESIIIADNGLNRPKDKIILRPQEKSKKVIFKTKIKNFLPNSVVSFYKKLNE